MSVMAWWGNLPLTVRASIKSGAFSALLALQTAFLVLIGAAAADGHSTSPADLMGYIGTHWWGVAIGFILPAAYRAREGMLRQQRTVTLAGGASYIINPPKGT